jgi:hypothetical protein
VAGGPPGAGRPAVGSLPRSGQSEPRTASLQEYVAVMAVAGSRCGVGVGVGVGFCVRERPECFNAVDKFRCRNHHQQAKRRSHCGPCVEKGANYVGTSSRRACALCGRHGMDTPRNQSHSRFGNERPGRVGGYWGSDGRSGTGVFCVGCQTPPQRDDRGKLKGGRICSHNHEADHGEPRRRQSNFTPIGPSLVLPSPPAARRERSGRPMLRSPNL